MHRLIPILSLAVACNGADTGGDGPFALTVAIPASYSIHDGADFTLAVVDSAGAVADELTGVVGTDSGTDFTVEAGAGYELHFWIDANMGGGTVGACDGDPDFFDHQWSYAVGTVDADRDFPIPAHNADFQDVCASIE